jgi:succinate dehydrogenase flavin-adding protein (antitoxin of CptAB toxin-antitoxin module)
MRELDELLAGYLWSFFEASSEPEKEAFRELLTLPDPELAEYLVTGRAIAEGVPGVVINKIRNSACAGKSRP